MKSMLMNKHISAVPKRISIYIEKLLQQRGAGIPLIVSNLLDIDHSRLMSRR